EKQKTRKEVSGKDECPTCGAELSSDEARKQLAHRLVHLKEEIAGLEGEEGKLLQEQAEKQEACNEADKQKRAAENSLQSIQRDLAVARSRKEDAAGVVSRGEKLVQKRKAQAGEWADQLIQLDALKEEKEKL